MSPAEDYLASSFRDVDSGAVDKMVRCLTFMDGLPDFQHYKSTIIETLHPEPGSTIADLGCGLGFDVRRLATLVGPKGKALGIDASHSFLTAARIASDGLPAASFIQADIQSLPLADGSLHACKVDRTLQHVEQPAAVLNQIFRTLRPGGVAVCSEPVWTTFVIAPQDGLSDQVAALFYAGFRNPHIGRDLNALLESTGFVDLRREDVILSTPTFAASDIVFDITQSAYRLAAGLGNEEPLAWLAEMRRQPVRCSVTLSIHFARKP